MVKRINIPIVEKSWNFEGCHQLHHAEFKKYTKQSRKTLTTIEGRVESNCRLIGNLLTSSYLHQCHVKKGSDTCKRLLHNILYLRQKQMCMGGVVTSRQHRPGQRDP